MKISQREMILGVGTLAAVLIGLSIYMVDSKSDAYQAKQTEIENLQAQIRLDERRIRMQEEWIAELNELQKDLRVFDSKQQSVAPELMKTIKGISSKHGFDITRSQPHPEKPTGDLVELGINCTWVGKLPAIVGFLTELQQQGVRYDVTSLNITPAGKNTGSLKGNIVINCAYTKKPNASKPKQ
ncbi:MAG: GspMb/PilO family protein [Pontiella sp.]